MEKHDHFFTPEYIDEQIEQRNGDGQDMPEGQFLAEMEHIAQQIRAEHERSLERVEARLKQYALAPVESHPAGVPKKQQDSLSLHHILQGRFNHMEKKKSLHSTMTKFGRLVSQLVAVFIMVLLVAGLVIIVNGTHRSTSTGSALKATSTVKATSTAALTPTATATATLTPTATATATATVTLTPIPPTSVKLSVSAQGIAPTTNGKITIPAGTKVTLTVIPDHSLLPFQTYTMGIYATDPYGFSELQDCQYPYTATCTYVIAYSSSENTDYTKGKHTFRAFLGNIGGAILANSSDVTITWS